MTRARTAGLVGALLLLGPWIGGGAEAAPPGPSPALGVSVGADQTVEDVIAFGVPVYVAGTVRESVVVIGGDLTLLGSAKVQGDIYILGGGMTQERGAQASGSITAVSPAIFRVLRPGRPGPALGLLLLVRLAVLLAVGAIAWHLAPTELVPRQMQRLRTRPVRVLGLAFLWAALLGTAGLVASLTVIGLPVGVLLLVFLGGEGVLGLAVVTAWIREPGRLSIRARRILIASLAFLGLFPLLGEALLFACAAVGLGITLEAMAEARGLRRSLLEAAQARDE